MRGSDGHASCCVYLMMPGFLRGCGDARTSPNSSRRERAGPGLYQSPTAKQAIPILHPQPTPFSNSHSGPPSLPYITCASQPPGNQRPPLGPEPAGMTQTGQS